MAEERVSGILVSMVREATSAMRDVAHEVRELRAEVKEHNALLERLGKKLKADEAVELELRAKLWQVMTSTASIPLVQMGIGVTALAIGLYIAVLLGVIQFVTIPLGDNTNGP